MLLTTSEETYQDGDVIFREGDSGDWVYVVESGAVELSKSQGDQKIVLEVLRSEDVFGEMAFIAGTKRTATAVALGETVVGVMDREWLLEEYNRMSSGFRSVIKCLVLRLKTTTDNMVGLTNSRQEPRKPIGFPVAFSHGDKKYKGACLNMAKSGMFIKVPEPIEEGDAIMLSVPVPGEDAPLVIKCVVAWNRMESQEPDRFPLGMGVKFLKLTDQDKQKIEKILLSQ